MAHVQIEQAAQRELLESLKKSIPSRDDFGVGTVAALVDAVREAL